MKKRWILNLVLLAIVAGIVAFLYMQPKKVSETSEYEVSSLKLADFTQVKVEFPAQAPVTFEKVDGLWRMTAPYKMRADQASVNRILSIIAAKSLEKLPADNPAKYGLDNPLIRLKLTNTAGEQVFVFGTHNPVSEEQYVAYQGAVYLLPTNYAEAAATQPIEMIDKAPLSSAESKLIAGFAFSNLEQWQEQGGLDMHQENGQWKVSLAKAKPTQNELNEWLDAAWTHAQAGSVELYKPDRKATYPGFDVLFKDGKKVHFDKIQEAPELLLARPDEGLVFHFSNDVGFNMLNPPLNIQ
jgi:hypothetical protein